MKKIKRLIVLMIGLTISLQSCTIEKRHFRPGYHIEWKNSSIPKQSNERIAKVEIMPTPEVTMSVKAETSDVVAENCTPDLNQHSEVENTNKTNQDEINNDSITRAFFEQIKKRRAYFKAQRKLAWEKKNTVDSNQKSNEIQKTHIGSSSNEKDRNVRLAILFTLIGIVSLLIVGFALTWIPVLLHYGWLPPVFLLGLIPPILCYFLGWGFACKAMYKHRKEKSRYAGRAAVRLIFWLPMTLLIIAATIGVIAIATFSIGSLM